MKLIDTRRHRDFFRIVASTPRSQAATMVLQPSELTGGANNVHASADQWLYVISGHGEATVGEQTVTLRAGTLLLIEAGEPHAIGNRGAEPFVTLNVYAPPEY